MYDFYEYLEELQCPHCFFVGMEGTGSTGEYYCPNPDCPDYQNVHSIYSDDE